MIERSPGYLQGPGGTTTLEDSSVNEPVEQPAIPGCAPWRAESGEKWCPSVHCTRCQTLRWEAGVPVLEPYFGGKDS